jgi:hypothetical protein
MIKILKLILIILWIEWCNRLLYIFVIYLNLFSTTNFLIRNLIFIFFYLNFLKIFILLLILRILNNTLNRFKFLNFLFLILKFLVFRYKLTLLFWIYLLKTFWFFLIYQKTLLLRLLFLQQINLGLFNFLKSIF